MSSYHSFDEATSWSVPEPCDWDEGQAEDDQELQEMAARHAKARQLDLDDIVARTCEAIAGKDRTPLHDVLAVLVDDPPPDLNRICLGAYRCEAVGRWVVLQLARSFRQAMGE
jgi:hypothetical protein